MTVKNNRQRNKLQGLGLVQADKTNAGRKKKYIYCIAYSFYMGQDMSDIKNQLPVYPQSG